MTKVFTEKDVKENFVPREIYEDLERILNATIGEKAKLIQLLKTDKREIQAMLDGARHTLQCVHEWTEGY